MIEEQANQVMSHSNPHISLHALDGNFNYQTMRIRRSVGKKVICVLIDTGSTHNFISYRMTLKLGCFLERIPVLKVFTANGDGLTYNEVCRKFTWWT